MLLFDMSLMDILELVDFDEFNDGDIVIFVEDIVLDILEKDDIKDVMGFDMFKIMDIFEVFIDSDDGI